ncbi:hypothetical protein GCM10025794_17570 [Massilia kyonggiensis]
MLEPKRSSSYTECNRAQIYNHKETHFDKWAGLVEGNSLNAL